jgi:glycosyltransferase involved in cell wall biosynthesis
MPSDKPLISVILPTYNRAPLIGKSIQSVLQQTWTHFELLVIDDGSSDNTDDVVKSINDPRITYVKYSENRGANHARNVGVKTAKGDYLAFQDSDDEWYPEKLEMHLNAFRNASSDIGVVYSGFYKITGSKKTYIPGKQISRKEGDILQELLKDNFISTPSVLIRRACFETAGDFDESLPRLQDWDLFIRLARDYRFKYIDQVTYHQYHTPNNISSNQGAKYEALEIIINKYEKDFTDKRLFADHCYSIGVWNYKTNKLEKARKYFFKAIQANPFFLKAYTRFLFVIWKEYVL